MQQRGGGDQPGYECRNFVEQRMISGGSNDKRLTDADSIGTTSFVPTSVSLLSLLPPTV